MCTACTIMHIMKVRIGISLDREVVDALEEQVRLSPDLSPDRSEIVNAVMKAFFRASVDHRVRTRELIILNRNGHLKLEGVHDVHSKEEQPIPMIKS